MEIKQISDLIGVTMKGVTNEGDERIVFETEAGEKYALCHGQDCCESVSVEDINGELSALIGSPILVAEEVVSNENPPGVTKDYQDSFTWTFYKFATAKGHVVIRWYGESNGYYSESVDFHQM